MSPSRLRRFLVRGSIGAAGPVRNSISHRSATSIAWSITKGCPVHLSVAASDWSSKDSSHPNTAVSPSKAAAELSSEGVRRGQGSQAQGDEACRNRASAARSKQIEYAPLPWRFWPPLSAASEVHPIQPIGDVGGIGPQADEGASHNRPATPGTACTVEKHALTAGQRGGRRVDGSANEGHLTVGIARKDAADEIPADAL
jgi:hypothetical protein